jgi:phosphoribosylformylglycinamidine synthase
VLPEGADPFVYLFSESAGRVLVSVPRTEETRFTAMLDARQLPWDRVGVADQAMDSVEIQDHFTVSLEELRSTHEGTLPALFG